MTEAIDPAIAAKIRASFARQALLATLGAELVEVAPGRVVIAGPILDLARQQHGYGHAGLAFTLGDTAAGYAALSMMPAEAEVMSAELKINLIAPSDGERMVATGRAVKVGRRLAVVTAEVEVEKAGRRVLVALLQGTMVPVLPRG